MRWRKLLGRRVILRTKNALSYAGTFLGIRMLPSRRRAVLVELDPQSGFTVACPLEWVEELFDVGIPE